MKHNLQVLGYTATGMIICFRCWSLALFLFYFFVSRREMVGLYDGVASLHFVYSSLWRT
jgi:hypothetical protein